MHTTTIELSALLARYPDDVLRTTFQNSPHDVLLSVLIIVFSDGVLLIAF